MRGEQSREKNTTQSLEEEEEEEREQPSLGFPPTAVPLLSENYELMFGVKLYK